MSTTLQGRRLTFADLRPKAAPLPPAPNPPVNAAQAPSELAVHVAQPIPAKPPQRPVEAPQAPPATLEPPAPPAPPSESAAPLLEELRARWPLAFREPPVPLAIGIHTAIREQASISKKRLKLALAIYCGSPRYLKAIIRREPRVDLDGQPAGEVTEEEANTACDRLAKLDAKGTTS